MSGSDLLPVATKEKQSCATKEQSDVDAIFKFYFLGVVTTNRDEWVYDSDRQMYLKEKVRFFIDFYEAERKRWLKEGRDFKKTKKEIPNDFVNRNQSGQTTYNIIYHGEHSYSLTLTKLYKRCIRPFVHRTVFSIQKTQCNDRLTSNHFEIFGADLQQENIVITFSGNGAYETLFHPRYQ